MLILFAPALAAIIIIGFVTLKDQFKFKAPKEPYPYEEDFPFPPEDNEEALF